MLEVWELNMKHINMTAICRPKGVRGEGCQAWNVKKVAAKRRVGKVCRGRQHRRGKG